MVLILMLIFRKKKKFDGEVFLWYLFGYGIGRFVIEGFRTDQLIMPVTGWPVSQALSLVLAVVAAVVVVVKRVKISRQEKMAEKGKKAKRREIKKRREYRKRGYKGKSKDLKN